MKFSSSQIFPRASQEISLGSLGLWRLGLCCTEPFLWVCFLCFKTGLLLLQLLRRKMLKSINVWLTTKLHLTLINPWTQGWGEKDWMFFFGLTSCTKPKNKPKMAFVYSNVLTVYVRESITAGSNTSSFFPDVTCNPAKWHWLLSFTALEP